MSDQRDSNSQVPWRTLLVGIGLGDLVILIFIVAFVRQFLWLVPGTAIPWLLTVAVSLASWLLHLRTNYQPANRLSFHFYLVVVLPLLFLFTLRVAFPDLSFDLLDYRLINAERALRGLPFIAGDFFPARWPFNPAPDMVTGITRHLFGYRLGTVINFLVLTWVAIIIDRLLRDFIQNPWPRSFAVLLVVLTEQALFVSTNYMVDLLAVPLLLEATVLTINKDESKPENKTLFRIALYLGAATAFKLTNLAFAIPILLVWFYRSFRNQSFPSVLKQALLGFVGIVVPLLPFTLFIFLKTGNPVFPLYNKIFQSPFWPTTDFAGVRWGPVVDDTRFANMHWWEILSWPILIPFKVEHAAGDLGPEPGRLLVSFVLAIIILILIRNNRKARSLAFMVLVGALLWSVTSGMARYAIPINLLGGVIAILVASLPGTGWRRIGQFALVVVLTVQSVISFCYAMSFDWGSRPTVFAQPIGYWNDSRYLLRDYRLETYLSDRDRKLVQVADGWIESSALESGVQVLLKPDTPAVCVYMPEYFGTIESRARFEHSMQQLRGRRLFALSRTDSLKVALVSIQAAGLKVIGLHQIVVPFYSDYTRMHMLLMEVSGEALSSIPITESTSSLSQEVMQAEITWLEPPPTEMSAGQRTTIYVKVRNVGNQLWPALPGNNGFQLLVGNHWVHSKQEFTVNDDGRSVLMFDVRPEAEIEIPVTITAPMTVGQFTLEVDLLQENVSWFASKGSKTLKTTVTVK